MNSQFRTTMFVNNAKEKRSYVDEEGNPFSVNEMKISFFPCD